MKQLIFYLKQPENIPSMCRDFPGAGKKISTAVTLAEFKHQSQSITIGPFLMPVPKSYVVFSKKLCCTLLKYDTFPWYAKSMMK